VDALQVCLIIPPSGFLIDDRVFPSLGILKVAAVLEAHGQSVQVLDLSGVKEFGDTVFPSADVYGMTATMPQMPAAFRIASMVRQQYPGLKIILGGPHPTLVRASARQEKTPARASKALRQLTDVFDVVVAGDGEKAILEAIRHDAPPLIDCDDLASPLYMTSADLDQAPLPARHLIDLESYHYQIDNVRTQSMIAQLGCPFGCVFCGGRRSPFLRRVRTRSTLAVIKEIAHLYEEYGTRGFMFLDDELNVNKNYMELLGAIIGLQAMYGVEFRLRGLLKSELVTDGMASAMYMAGFRQVLIGFESGSDRILRNIQKHATVEQNSRCVDILGRHGIRVKALMSFGHAGESIETVEATRDWLLEVRPDDFDVTIITVYPGTPYYDDAVEEPAGVWTYTAANGDRLYQKDVDQRATVNFYKGVPYSYQSFVWTDQVSSEDLVRYRDDVESDVRSRLGIPFPSAAAELNYEHSMGMS
jgi:anaerobic magnesium-protoporphyrin IX monomethyl ester cyclase